MAQIIGFCNQKGGTGKTTSAVNVSAFLAMAGYKTLLVDMDPQGNATTGAGVGSITKRTSIYEAILGETSLKECATTTSVENMSLIPSAMDLTGLEVELVNFSDREQRLRSALGAVSALYEYIIIDSPPSLGLLTINVLTAVDQVIIPMQCEYYALEGLSAIINIIELIRNRLNNAISIKGILFTMADFRTRLTMQVISEVKKAFPSLTFNTVIPRNVRLAEAPSFGKPIFTYDPLCSGARAYFSLTEEIVGSKIQGVYNG
jgi:chromosome partitioning protein